ncbi:MAG TPA: M14 family zinc carboxypeptidase [Pyrinomonadaceae bacterium]|nr:M14 family zinc carboxypeptidase [Pyrinomonadaceae bacterium]
MKIKSLLFFSLLCVVFAQNVFSQPEEKFDFYTRGAYRAEVPRPQSILRFDVGNFHTTYAQMERVIEAIAKAAPDRVKIFDIGETNEHRMQYIIAISAPENMARLDEIKTNNARLTDSRKTSPTEASQIAQTNPAIAWMAYTIHGNESASFEAMMQVVYQLAASNEPATLDILKNNVTLVIPGENPDGHERFVTWYNSVATGNADRNALEHREPWSINGRYNHFRFDLNRDNIASTQIETKNLQKAFFEWNPQVLVDHHGQPAQYFFPPAALPINPNLPQPATNKWLDMFGRANAQAFDQNKWDYYVRDIFDLFYPGYWDSFPALNGAIGMTYETDGGGFKGLRWTRDDGTIVTLRSAIAKHYVASLTTLETVAKNRAARIADYYDFRRAAIEETTREKLKRIVIDPSKDTVKTAEMMEILLRAKIEVKVANSPFSSSTARSYSQSNAPKISQTFPAGAYVIELNQPQKRLIKALLEQDTPQDAAFVRDNMARFRRNARRSSSASKEEYGFYDITAWNLPLAFGVDAFSTEEAGNVNANLVSSKYLETAKRGNVSGRAQIAYIIPYQTDGAGVLALRLLKENFRVAVATKTLTAGGRNYNRGTFVVRVTRNPETVHEAINRLAKELGVNVFSVNTGYTDEGDTNVGSENVVSLKSPKIAVVADETVNQTSYGSIWWTLDRYGIDFTPLTLANVKSGALKNYTVLIMPDGSASRYFGAFGSGGVSSLKEWISGGGTLITVKGASVFAALKDVGLTSSKLVGSDADEEKGKAPDGEETDKRKEAETRPSPTPEKAKAKPQSTETEPNASQELKFDKADGISPVLPPIASPSANAGTVPEAIPGSIMRATVDRTTYLTYGIEDDNLPVLLSSGYFFRISKDGTNALLFEQKPKNPLTISGFVWEGNTEKLLQGTAYLIDEPTGAGHVVLFAEEPFFRGIFRTATRPFFNSILFNGTF